MSRKKTTVYLDPELLHAVKVLAASTGRHDYEILEAALRQYLGAPQAEASRQALRQLLGQLGAQTSLSEEEEVLDLAYAELHAARQARRQN
ncbi:MAG: ribbon-helix-helix protein, CopG family [Chloroflexi bacterium]|nr:ribbon-helix-helix protein, CopG family [Chloroflexota bacterium]